MIEMLIDVASAVLILLGSFFIVVGAVGLLRLPDLFSRVHGASVIDTAGAGFLIAGLMLQAGASLVTLKLVFILAVFFFTLPVAAHALAQAALHERIRPALSEDRTGGALEAEAAPKPARPRRRRKGRAP
jgi:multicomponent Na+:H+ antiporter subunit G